MAIPGVEVALESSPMVSIDIRKATGLPDDFRFHGLRRHFASMLVSSGIDLTVVRELLTHKDMTATQRYARLRPDAVREAAQKSGDLLTNII